MYLPKHGANPKYVYKRLALQMPEKVIDFSVNLNPLGPPKTIFDSWDDWKDDIIDYPDPLGQNLKEKLSKKEQIDSDNILLGNGAAELIQLIANHFRGKNILLFQPTFSEYERMCLAYDVSLTNISVDILNDAHALEEAVKGRDALFLCHPNNPTGEIYDETTLERLLHICEKNKCYLILDEAFFDFSEEVQTMVTKIEVFKYLIILRSVTKMYAIAGIRLGMLFAEKKVIAHLRRFQPYWSVNTIALKIGEKIIDESSFVKDTQHYIAEIRNQIFPELQKLGFDLTNSKVNFFLLRDPDIENQHELLLFLLQQGIIPRHTENYPYLNGTWLRFAVRPLDEMNDLLGALKEWKER